MFKRRIVRYCDCGCGEKLVRKENESITGFMRRKYMDRAHAARMKHNVGPSNQCFCGRTRQQESPYCCWDHRLIAIKCKKWGIPLSVAEHDKHSHKLFQEQMAINDKCKPGIMHSAYF